MTARRSPRWSLQLPDVSGDQRAAIMAAARSERQTVGQYLVRLALRDILARSDDQRLRPSVEPKSVPSHAEGGNIVRGRRPR